MSSAAIFHSTQRVKDEYISVVGPKPGIISFGPVSRRMDQSYLPILIIDVS